MLVKNLCLPFFGGLRYSQTYSSFKHVFKNKNIPSDCASISLYICKSISLYM